MYLILCGKKNLIFIIKFIFKNNYKIILKKENLNFIFFDYNIRKSGNYK